jgi:hypothetical protein
MSSAVEYTWTCDLCCDTKKTSLNCIPSNWTEATLHFSYVNKNKYHSSVHLCGVCVPIEENKVKKAGVIHKLLEGFKK